MTHLSLFSCVPLRLSLCFFFFFFNDTATTEIYTLSLHDALPISESVRARGLAGTLAGARQLLAGQRHARHIDRKSTRLNSSHLVISYAVFCLKKKKTQHATISSQPYIAVNNLHHTRPATARRLPD